MSCIIFPHKAQFRLKIYDERSWNLQVLAMRGAAKFWNLPLYNNATRWDNVSSQKQELSTELLAAVAFLVSIKRQKHSLKKQRAQIHCCFVMGQRVVCLLILFEWICVIQSRKFLKQINEANFPLPCSKTVSSHCESLVWTWLIIINLCAVWHLIRLQTCGSFTPTWLPGW